MKKKKWLGAAVLALSVALCATACGGKSNDPNDPNNPNKPQGPTGDVYEDYDPDKKPGGDQFDYDGNYTAPELNIDGKGDDEQWQNTPVLTTFGKNGNAASVKVYRGDSAMFFLFEVQDDNLLTYGNTNDDNVNYSDSIELWLDTKADGGRVPQSDDFQYNLAIHGKARILQGAGGALQWGAWNGLVDYEVDLQGTLNDGIANDKGYTIELMVPYNQIMIEKDDTIGIYFSHVNKIADVKDREWFGWPASGSDNPQIPDNYMLLDKNNHLISRDELPMPSAFIAGTVTDTEGNAVADAKVSIDGESVTTTTNEDGRFSFPEGFDSEGTYTVTVEKDGYLNAQITYTRAELRAANGGFVEKAVELIPTANLKTTTVTGTVKNIVYGTVEGATATVKGTTISADTQTGGTFSLADVPANIGEITLVITKTGYGDTELTLAESELVADGTTALGNVNLNLQYTSGVSLAPADGKTPGYFINATVLVTRTLTGIEFRFDGDQYFHNGQIELYLDTKDTSTVHKNTTPDKTFWQINIKADGTLTASRASTSTSGLVYKVLSNNEDEGYHATLLIPYSYLNITELEVFGFAAGQWVDAIGDWDPMYYNGGEVSTDTTAGYLRVSALNGLYRSDSNDTVATFSGNAGAGGITVTANGKNTVTDSNGDWSMTVPVTSAAVSVTYSARGYVTKTTTIEAGHFGGTVYAWSENVTLLNSVTVSGTVTDQNDNPVAGATVTIEGFDGLSATTDADGRYTIPNVPISNDIRVTFECDGYAEGYETVTAADLSTSATHSVSKKLTTTENITYVTLTGKVVGIEGALEGVTVTLDGDGELSAQTDANGAYSIANVPCIDGTLTVSLDGFVSQTVSLRADDVESGALEDIFLAREYEEIGGAFATATRNPFANITPYVTRGESAFLFKFVAENEFTGKIEFFVNTKLTSGRADEKHNGDYLFNLSANGDVSVTNFGDGTNTGNATLVSNVETENGKTVLYFTLPYAFLNVQQTEIIGVSFGQAIANDWDGWNYTGAVGYNGTAYVNPAITADFVRIGADNKSFWNGCNATLEELDMTGYDFYQPEDRIFVKVTRDETGVTIDAIAFGDFNKDGSYNEMLLVYFDFGETVGGWNGVDYLVKIATDGKVYGGGSVSKLQLNPGNGASWWKENDSDVIGSATVKSESADGIAYKRVTCTVSYTTFNADIADSVQVTANDVFGIQFREASQDSTADHKLYGSNCSFRGAVTGDTANCANYIRVKADGTLVVANSNSAV